VWYEALRDKVKSAKELGVPWHALASILRRSLQGLDSEEQARLWRLAARESRLSETMLRRYVLALERLSAIEVERKLQPGELRSGAFAPVEIALRLYSRDPEAGLNALEALKQRRVTLRDLRRELAETPSDAADPVARSRSLRDRGVLVARAEGLVDAEAPGLFGAGATANRRPSARYLRRVGFEFRDAEHRILGGADLYLAESGGRDNFESLAQSVLLARYLPVFYVVVGPDLEQEEARRAAAALETLAATSIGVLHLRDEGSALLVRPAVPDPARDDPSRYRGLLKAFATGRAPTA